MEGGEDGEWEVGLRVALSLRIQAGELGERGCQGVEGGVCVGMVKVVRVQCNQRIVFSSQPGFFFCVSASSIFFLRPFFSFSLVSFLLALDGGRREMCVGELADAAEVCVAEGDDGELNRVSLYLLDLVLLFDPWV